MKHIVEVGSQWVYDNQIVQIDGPNTLQEVFVRFAVTGEHRSIRIDALKPLPATSLSVDVLHIPESEWRRAEQLRRALQPFSERSSLPRAAALEIAQAVGLSVRQVQRWRRRFQVGGKTSDLASGRSGRRRGTRYVDPTIEAIIAQTIECHYGCAEPASMTKIAERVRLTCQQRGLRPPAERTVYSRIHALRGADLLAKQRGRKAANQAYAARAGVLTSDRAMGLVQIDHTRVDVQLVDDEGRVIGRPWVTLAIDVCTRSVVGWYLTMDAPSAISVAMCVAHMMCPKPENRDDAMLWPMYGRPERILVDNGRDLKSQAFQRGCEEHGIELQWRPPGQPHYGGHIERLMGTLMTEVHELPGTTFSRSHQRGEYPSEQRACLTLGELREWMIDRICRGYHVRPHRGLNGRTPLLAWEEAHRDCHGRQLLPAMPMGPDALHRDFFPFVFRRLQRTGIQWAGTRYWHPSLAPFVGPEVHLRLHYHPDDSSRAWVRIPGGDLVEVLPVAGRAIDGPRHRPTAAELARTQAVLAAGYVHSDAIVAEAKRRKQKSKHRGASTGSLDEGPAGVLNVSEAEQLQPIETADAPDSIPKRKSHEVAPIARIKLAVEVDE